MKKLLTLALVAIVAISTQAASIMWSSDAVSFGGTTLKNNASVAGYLIALEGSSLAASYDLAEGFSTAKSQADNVSEQNTDYEVQTTRLYRIAESFIKTIKQIYK